MKPDDSWHADIERSAPSPRASFALAGLAVAVLAIIVWTLVAQYRHGNVGRVADRALGQSDFAAFYCASKLARTGVDPYKAAPLMACQEREVFVPAGLSRAESVIDPAPLPPYDFAFFAPLTYLTYRVDGLVWIALLVAANFAAAFGLARLTQIPVAIVIAALAVTNGSVCYLYGQEQPVVTLALVAAALLLRAERTNLAAAVASLSLIEPHVGLPVMLALLVWTRARTVVLASFAVFAGISVAMVGIPINIEYFARELPVHALSEVTVWFQYSFTAILHMLGVPDLLALRLASIQYALTLALGVIVAGPLARRMGSPTLVLFPPVCAVLGGPFIHITQIASALPFALWAAMRLPRYRGLAWIAAIFLATQWPEAQASAQLIAAIAIFGAAFYACVPLPVARRFAIGAAAFTLWFGINFAIVHAPFANLRPLPTEAQITALVAPYDPTLASTVAAGGLRRDVERSEFSARRIVPRIPAWAGLILLVAIGVAATRTGSPRPRLRPN